MSSIDRSFSDSRLWTLLFVVSVVAIVPYLALSFFIHPAADDFSYAVKTVGRTFWQVQTFIYSDWSGRYFSTAVLSLNPVTENAFWAYKFYSVAIILFLFAAIFVFIRAMFPTDFSRKKIGFITLALFALMLNRLPSTSEGLYWMAGFVTYMIATGFLLIGWSILLKRRALTFSASAQIEEFSLIKFVALLISAYVIIGSNETAMLIWDVSLAALFIEKFIKERSEPIQKRIDGELLLLGIFSLALSIFVLASPGNAARAAYFERPGILLAAAYSSGLGTWHIIRFISPALIFFIIAALPWLMDNSHRFNKNLFSKRAFYITLGTLIAINFLTLFPAYYSMGGRPPRRTLNMVLIFHHILLILAIFQTCMLNQVKARQFLQKKFIHPKHLLVLFALAFFLVGNNRKAFVDLTTRASSYNQQMQDRYKMIQQNQGLGLVVPAITDPPKTIVFDDITPDPSDWRNDSYAQYFGLKSIRTDK